MATLLSKNFSYEEMIASATAKAKKIDNSTSPEIRKKLEKLYELATH